MVDIFQADYSLLLQVCQDFFELIGNFIYDMFLTVIEYLPYFILYALAFVLLLGFGYVKLLYCKAKGYTNRANSLEQSLNTYFLFIRYPKSVIKGVMDVIPVA
jgi:hypothetical protein